MEVHYQRHVSVGLPHGERDPDANGIGGWVDSGGNLDILENRKISCHSQELGRGSMI
jgi:hypothetical protein